MNELIEENDTIDDWGQALHFLIQQYNEKLNNELIIAGIDDIKGRQQEINNEKSKRHN